MKWIVVALQLLWKIWFLLYMLLSTIVLFPFVFFTIVILKNYKLTFHTVYKVWSWSICIAIGIIPKIINKEKLPNDAPYVMVANHTSQLDIVVPYTLMNHYFAFLAKEELTKAPLFKTNFRGMNVTVNRRDMISGAGAIKACGEKLRAGNNLLIFPEGTRSKVAPKMQAFKAGPFKLAVEHEVPIVPILFLDNYKRLEGGNTWLGKAGPGRSRVLVLDPISTRGLTSKDVQSLIAKTQQKMEDALEGYIA